MRSAISDSSRSLQFFESLSSFLTLFYLWCRYGVRTDKTHLQKKKIGKCCPSKQGHVGRLPGVRVEMETVESSFAAMCPSRCLFPFLPGLALASI